MSGPVVDAERVRAAVGRWRRGEAGALDGLSEAERSVVLVALGYDTPSHAAMVGIPVEHLGPARETARLIFGD